MLLHYVQQDNRWRCAERGEVITFLPVLASRSNITFLCRIGELLSAITQRVQELRLRDTAGKNEPNEDNPNDNSPVTRLRRAMGALYEVKQRDTYAKLLDAVREKMGDQLVLETQQVVECSVQPC